MLENIWARGETFFFPSDLHFSPKQRSVKALKGKNMDRINQEEKIYFIFLFLIFFPNKPYVEVELPDRGKICIFIFPSPLPPGGGGGGISMI
jgi:hypothetical protein